jgi:hypothetical protein
MISQAAPAVEEQWALAFPLLIREVNVVQPPGRADTFYLGVGLLLPVQPPEVNALMFERMVQQIHVVGCELLVGDVEGDILSSRRIDAHLFGHGWIGCFPRLNAGGRVKVECDLQALIVEVSKERLGVGEEEWVPGVAGPTQVVPRLIGLMHGFQLDLVEMPVHVDDEHIQRDIVFMEAAHEIIEFLVAIGPVTRPPDSEGEARRQRYAASDTDVVAECLLVVVTVAEEVPVLAVACRPQLNPGPCALLAILKAEVVGVKERPR